MNNNLIRTILERELEQKNLFYPFLSGLTGREQKVLELRNQSPKKTLEYIGDKLKLTRERTRQIETRAYEKIKVQKDIVQTLANKLGEYLFEEGEIEKTFLSWVKEDSVAGKKIRWQDFNKLLWKLKQKNE